jgi:hypothetical protein
VDPNREYGEYGVLYDGCKELYGASVDADGLESDGGRAGNEGGSEDELVVVDGDAAAMIVAGVAAAVLRSQGLGGDAISRAQCSPLPTTTRDKKTCESGTAG